VTTVLAVAPTRAAGAALEALGKRRPDLSVTVAVGAASLIQPIEEARPEVLVLARPPASLVARLRELARRARPPAVVVLTDDPRPWLRPDALRSGVRGVLPGEAEAVEVIAAIDAAAAGLLTIHPDLLDALRPSAPVRRAPPGVADQPLTARELEVLSMLAEGLGNKTIAARLGISGHTVKFHLASIFAKLGAGTRTEAVALGVRRGLIAI
jgi:DNA-binding NarL/FixJ family response regulator